MTHKVAFAGFRHGHINGLFKRCCDMPGWKVTAVCEEDAAALEQFRKTFPEYDGPVYTSYEEMLKNADCEIVATGDYYGRRGTVLIGALRAGKHVIGDKPLCTSLEELDQIEKLAAEKKLAVGCMLDLRTGSRLMKARELVLSGRLGEIMQIQFSGQHPLMEDTRPGWYFEEGKHGGTINDIAIHAFDCIPWMTGLEFDRPVAARCWHTPNTSSKCFQGGAQMMCTLSNGCGVIGDVSYSQPSSFAYRMPQYWRFTVWGIKGTMEFTCGEGPLKLWLEGESEVLSVEAEEYAGPNYLDWFLDEIEGKPAVMNTAAVLKAARRTLEVQKLADQTRC